MQLRSADEGSTIFYKVRVLGGERRKGSNVDFLSVSTVEIKRPPITSFSKNPIAGLRVARLAPDSLEMTCP